MAKKRYISNTGIQYTFPVFVKEKSGAEKAIWVSFSGTSNDYLTSNKDVQIALESHCKFAAKDILLADGGVPEDLDVDETIEEVVGIDGAKDTLKGAKIETVVNNKPIENVVSESIKVIEEEKDAAGLVDFPNVVDINGAKDTLKGEPYNVPHQSLRTPEAIMAKAVENNISFSNWSV